MDNSYFSQRISPVSNYNFINTGSIVAVPKDLLDVTGTQFYEYNDIQGGSGASKTSSGKLDAISTLYTEDGID